MELRKHLKTIYVLSTPLLPTYLPSYYQYLQKALSLADLFSQFMWG